MQDCKIHASNRLRLQPQKVPQLRASWLLPSLLEKSEWLHAAGDPIYPGLGSCQRRLFRNFRDPEHVASVGGARVKGGIWFWFCGRRVDNFTRHQETV